MTNEEHDGGEHPVPEAMEVRMRDEIVQTAVELVHNIRCVCDPCWTERDRHDPKGCTWEELEELRGVVTAWLGARR